MLDPPAAYQAAWRRIAQQSAVGRRMRRRSSAFATGRICERIVESARYSCLGRTSQSITITETARSPARRPIFFHLFLAEGDSVMTMSPARFGLRLYTVFVQPLVGPGGSLISFAASLLANTLIPPREKPAG